MVRLSFIMLAKMDNKALYLYELNLDNFLMLKMIFGQNSDQCVFLKTNFIQ